MQADGSRLKGLNCSRGISIVGAVMVVALTRIPTLRRLSLDWDESLYLLIARQWRLAGISPAAGLFDHKPPVIYAILAPFCDIGQGGVLGMRLVTMAFVAASAVSVGLIAEFLVDRRAGTAASFVYPAMSMLLGGPASNTEHFFLAFFHVGALCLLHAQRRPALYFVTGVLWGLAFSTKFVVAVQIAAFFFVVYRYHRPSHGAVLRIAGAFSATVALIFGPLFLGEHADQFFQRLFLSNATHVDSLPGEWWSRFATGMGRFLIFIAPCLCILGIVRQQQSITVPKRNHMVPPLLSLWFLSTLVEASLAGRFYDHYFISSFAAISVILGTQLSKTPSLQLRHLGAFVFLAYSPAFYQNVYQWMGKSDPVGVVHQAIEEQCVTEKLFVLNYEPVLYALADVSPPTPLAFPPFLVDDHFYPVTGVDGREEVQRVLQTMPECVIVRDDRRHAVVSEAQRWMNDAGYTVSRPVPFVELWQAPHVAETQ